MTSMDPYGLNVSAVRFRHIPQLWEPALLAPPGGALTLSVALQVYGLGKRKLLVPLALGGHLETRL